MFLSAALFSQTLPDTAVTPERAFEKQWIRYLERNIDLNVPIDKGCKSGTFKVVIQFRIDKDGHITGVYALTTNGYGLEEEVARVIKKWSNWGPGLKGDHLAAYKTQPVIFMLGDREPDHSKHINVSNAPGLLNEVTVFAIY